MGMDFEYSYVMFPRVEGEEFGPALAKFCDQVEKRIAEVKEYDIDELKGALANLRECGGREGGIIPAKEEWIVFSGGMSWGEAPSDFYCDLCALNEAGVV